METFHIVVGFMVDLFFGGIDICINTVLKMLQSVSWILAEFCYNRSPQGPYTGTCMILQETVNGFLCPLIVFRKM